MLRPKKVSLEGEKYLVEVQVQKRTATVQVDLATGEIKGFQIEESTESSGFAFSKRMLFPVVGVVAVIAVVVVLKLMGIF